MTPIKSLRQHMSENGITHCLIFTNDYHNSEYIDDYFKIREFLSGFTGSNGTLFVGMDEAHLWTDGRYFIQAEKELEDTGIILEKMGQEGVLSPVEFMKKNLIEQDCLAVDGRLISVATGEKLEKELRCKIDLAWEFPSELWDTRPKLSANPVWDMEEISGESSDNKLKRLRKALEEEECDAIFMNKLDDIMWLFNIRGGDVACNPVAFSYCYITGESCVIFLQENVLKKSVLERFEALGIEVGNYMQIEEFLKNDVSAEKIWVDDRSVNYTYCQILKQKSEIYCKNNPTEKWKAVKNETELENMRKVYVKDSAALTKYLFWLKEKVKTETINEYEAGEYLDSLRRKVDGFLDLSFDTISAYGENAAMMHYSAKKDSCSILKSEGMYLVDSGGQYFGGTTDVTRTIALGEVTDEMKKHFTAVLRGMLALSNAIFLKGCTGRSLDILARRPVWEMGIDYKCGTGHGIGYMLNVHEGPQNIRSSYIEGLAEAVLEEGMVVSNEPGVYLQGKYGIRTENILAVTFHEKNEDGTFLKFETLTYVPIDLDLVDVNQMSEKEILWLNRYQEKVYEMLEPYMVGEEKEWLKIATRVSENI